jgi:hypothetical protein
MTSSVFYNLDDAALTIEHLYISAGPLSIHVYRVYCIRPDYTRLVQPILLLHASCITYRYLQVFYSKPAAVRTNIHTYL